MKTIDDSSCFACGQDNEAGLKIQPKVDAEKRKSSFEIEIPAKFQGWKNIVHGGIVGTLLDEASIYACSGDSKNGVTAELNVKYKSPVPTEKKVFVSAEVVEIRRNIFIVASKVECDGKICAIGKAKIFNLEKKEK